MQVKNTFLNLRCVSGISCGNEDDQEVLVVRRRASSAPPSLDLGFGKESDGPPMRAPGIDEALGGDLYPPTPVSSPRGRYEVV